jgi:hypothetical protein
VLGNDTHQLDIQGNVIGQTQAIQVGNSSSAVQFGILTNEPLLAAADFLVT